MARADPRPAARLRIARTIKQGTSDRRHLLIIGPLHLHCGCRQVVYRSALRAKHRAAGRVHLSDHRPPSKSRTLPAMAHAAPHNFNPTGSDLLPAASQPHPPPWPNTVRPGPSGGSRLQHGGAGGQRASTTGTHSTAGGRRLRTVLLDLVYTMNTQPIQ